LRFQELKLEKVILRSRFSLDDRSSNPLIQNGIVFINGLVVTNPQIYLYVGDFIQLYVNIKYYIVYRWLYN
jgi:ribosomal protein S4